MAVVKEEEIARLMKLTNSTREEVLDMLDCDKRIDRGEKLFELDDELKAGAKKARQAERKAGVVAKKMRKRLRLFRLCSTPFFPCAIPMKWRTLKENSALQRTEENTRSSFPALAHEGGRATARAKIMLDK